MRSPLLIEGLATFFLCLGCALAQGPLAPFTVGALLLALIYVGGPVSRAHYNPAVTLAFCLRGRHAWSAGLAYAAVQLLAAVVAGLVLGLMHGHNEESSQHILEALKGPMMEGWFGGLFVEVLGTFLMGFVILTVATSRRAAGNGYYGLAIAAVVAALMGMFGGYFPDFNPAVTVAKSLEGVCSALNPEGDLAPAFGQELAYLAHATPRLVLGVVGQFAGAALAARAFLGTFPEER